MKPFLGVTPSGCLQKAICISFVLECAPEVHIFIMKHSTILLVHSSLSFYCWCCCVAFVYLVVSGGEGGGLAPVGLNSNVFYYYTCINRLLHNKENTESLSAITSFIFVQNFPQHFDTLCIDTLCINTLCIGF